MSVVAVKKTGNIISVSAMLGSTDIVHHNMVPHQYIFHNVMTLMLKRIH